jgi:isopenicillin N synthase-like dioxygenase
MRVYRYLRPPAAAGAPAPGLWAAATGAHCDVGLLTVAPLATVPGLVLLSPCGERWVGVEAEEQEHV